MKTSLNENSNIIFNKFSSTCTTTVRTVKEDCQHLVAHGRSNPNRKPNVGSFLLMLKDNLGGGEGYKVLLTFSAGYMGLSDKCGKKPGRVYTAVLPATKTRGRYISPRAHQAEAVRERVCVCVWCVCVCACVCVCRCVDRY